MIEWNILEIAKRFSTSEAFSTLVAGAFGAFFGAWGAQAVIGRNQTKERVIAELNSVRATLMLCFSISNAYITLKKQHIFSLQQQYKQAQREFRDFEKAAANHPGPQPLIFELHTDFRTITPVKTPTETLERYIFEKISIHGRALAAAVTLIGAIDNLNKSIVYRNDIIDEFRQAALPHRELIEKYLGVRNATGGIDERYPSSVIAISTLTDDCIFFSHLLADDLLAYGRRLRRRSFWKFRLFLPTVTGADWSAAEAAGLIPPREKYSRWLGGFKQRPSILSRIGGFGKLVISWARGRSGTGRRG